MDRRPNTVRITSEILPTERGRNTRETSSGTTVTDVGAEVFQPWRERPHPWPRAWHAKRSFQVVAHATVLLLATAPAAAPPRRAA